MRIFYPGHPDLPTDRPFLMADEGYPVSGGAIPEGKMIDEMTGDVVDDSCYCDGTDDGYYACSFPPCVVERHRA